MNDERKQSFGAWAVDYERYRPGYNREIVQHVLDYANRPRPLRVLDIGAGTGQLCRVLMELGCDVVAVEPDKRMRDLLVDRVGAERAHAGTAEEMPLPDDSVDVVVGGQMWHWVDQDRALPEIARVLRRGGVLAIIWNLRDDRVDWVAAMNEVVELPDAYKWFEQGLLPDFGPAFTDPEFAEFENNQPSSPEDLVGLVGTFSQVGLSDDRDQTLAAVRTLTETHPQLAGEDSFDVPYIAKMFLARRK